VFIYLKVKHLFFLIIIKVATKDLLIVGMTFPFMF